MNTMEQVTYSSVAGETRVYARRWLVLFIYVLFAIVNGMQWTQYAIINNVVTRYYGVSSVAVDWTAIIFVTTYAPLIFPAMYLLQKKGLRCTILMGAAGTALGSWLKALSASPNLFWLTFLGQTFVAASQVFLLSIPPRLSAVWFGPNQVSTATSIGVFGNQVGMAAGFMLPPTFVKNRPSLADVGADLALMYQCTAGMCTFVLILVIIFFQNAPPLPPSKGQLLQIQQEDAKFFSGIKKLFQNKGFMLLVLTYSLLVAVINSLSTLLNQLILTYFPNGEEFAGRVGLVFVIGGMIGSVVFGIILDYSHKFKETTVIVYILSATGLLIFTFTLSSGSYIAVYVSAVLMGIFLNGYMPVGFELGSEITYPEPEGTVAGLIILGVQLLSIVHTVIYTWLIDVIGDFWANVVLGISLFLGTALTALIPSHMRRQEASKKNVTRCP